MLNLRCNLNLYFINEENTTISDIYKIIKQNIINQIYYIIQCKIKYNIKNTEIYTFSPFQKGLINICLFDDKREIIHNIFGYPKDRFIFSKYNIINDINNNNTPLKAETKTKSVHLLNVHKEIKNKDNISNIKEYTIDGDYRYYHYLQDGERDSGWGCAYRSLQSIYSFFIENHYVDDEDSKYKENRNIPTIKEVFIN